MATIDTFYPTEFERSFSQALQQMDSRLLNSVTRADFTGKKKWFNLINDSEAQDVLTRKGDTPDGEFDGSKYWLTQRPKEKVTVFDEFDKHFLGSIVLPTSDEVASHAMAFNRAIDDVIISAFDATRYIGEDGTTADTFNSTYSIASSYVESGSAAQSGLTIGKLRRAKYLMDLAEVPNSDRMLVCGAQQVQDLLRTTEVTSDDYNSIKALVSGQVDTFLGSIVLPTSDEVQSHAMAFNRAIDDVIINAFDATRYIGEDGTTSDAFNSSYSIASSYVETGSAAQSGLTIGKLRRAKYLMDLAEVPNSDRMLVCGAQQVQDLLRTTEVTSDDYNSIKALVSGQVDTFLGFKFLSSQRLINATVSSVTDIRSCFAFHKTAIKFAMSDRKVQMDILPTRRHALQIRSTMMLGAVRTENEKVVRIYCDESP